jgi:hypothetical protein
MAYKLIFLTLINFCYANQQTLILSFYNNTNCANTYLKQDRFSDNCMFDYDSCCRNILNKEEIENNQKINTCYLDNNTKTSYYYTCKYDNNSAPISIWIVVLFITLMLIVCSIAIFSKRNKQTNYLYVNDFTYDTLPE